MKILGLDASSTTIGLCVLNAIDGKFVLEHCEFYKPPKKGDIFERLAAVRKYINSKIDEFSPDEIVLEDIILYMPGKSTARTISMLAVLNRTVGLAIYDRTGKSPHLLNVMKIRHKIKLNKKLPRKEEIPELVATILGIPFPYELNRKGKVVKENYDIADAIALSLAFAKINFGIK